MTVSDDGVGAITVLFGSRSYHDERFLRLTAIATDGAVSFPCTTDIEEPYRPKDCEEGVETDSDTDLFKIASNSLLGDPIPLPDEFDETDIEEEEEEEEVVEEGPVPWNSIADGDACWNEAYAGTRDDGNGWVKGKASECLLDFPFRIIQKITS